MEETVATKYGASIFSRRWWYPTAINFCQCLSIVYKTIKINVNIIFMFFSIRKGGLTPYQVFSNVSALSQNEFQF